MMDHYVAPRMLLTAVGGVDHSKLHNLAQKYFGDMSGVALPEGHKDFQGIRFTGSEVSFNLFLSHIF